MAVEHYEIHTCDRCANTLKVNQNKNHEELWSWGYLWYGQNNGPIYAKISKFPNSTKQYTELCEQCLINLNDWFNKGKSHG